MIINIFIRIALSVSFLMLSFSLNSQSNWKKLLSYQNPNYSIQVYSNFWGDSIKVEFLNVTYKNLVAEGGLGFSAMSVKDTISYAQYRDPDFDYHFITKYYQINEPNIYVLPWDGEYNNFRFSEDYYNLWSTYKLARELGVIDHECFSEECRVKGILVLPVGEKSFRKPINLEYKFQLYRDSLDSIKVVNFEVIDNYKDIDTLVVN